MGDMPEDSIIRAFNGDVPNYLKFKKKWKKEVVLEQDLLALELEALRDSVLLVLRL